MEARNGFAALSIAKEEMNFENSVTTKNQKFKNSVTATTFPKLEAST